MPIAADRIDVHAHLLPGFLREALVAGGRAPSSGYFPDWSPAIALELMGRHGIATQILSASSPGVHFGDDAAARALARRTNELIARTVTDHPRNFGGFATLPLPDVAGALAELDYAFDILRMDGACLFASYSTGFLGDPVFEPILAALDARAAVVFVHPSAYGASPHPKLPWPAFMMEFLFDTTRAAVNLLFSGALDRYPRIRFILAHAGGVLPFLSWRLGVAPMISQALPRWSPERIAAGLRRFWFDTALSPGAATFGALDAVADPRRILFGSDWPWAAEPVTRATIEALVPRPGVDRANALELFPRLA